MTSKKRLICWSQKAWDDYLAWQEQDRKTLKRINKLITECLREPFTGAGKPEILKGNWHGWFPGISIPPLKLTIEMRTL